jgi:hypothetical protein
LLAAGVELFESDDELVDAGVEVAAEESEPDDDDVLAEDDEVAASELFLESRLSVR